MLTVGVEARLTVVPVEFVSRADGGGGIDEGNGARAAQGARNDEINVEVVEERTTPVVRETGPERVVLSEEEFWIALSPVPIAVITAELVAPAAEI
jgi:hypothetical protein